MLAGFYPDPSICKVKNDYYLTNSTFACFPGLPIFHSIDLLHWFTICNQDTIYPKLNFKIEQ
nr:family 43 glycosylhydrolase [Hydrotalea sp.]